MPISGEPGSSYDSQDRITPTRIGIVTPAPAGSRRGNRVTAERWAAILKDLGHAVEVVERSAGEPFDILVALHAGRSAASVRRFRDRHPGRPLLLAVTGTDLYTHDFDPGDVQHSLAAADRVIVSQPRTAQDLGPGLASKVRVIFHSA